MSDMTLPSSVTRRASLIGILLGAGYGLLARIAVATSGLEGGLFFAMTIGFLFCVPFAMGYLTVRPVTAPSLVYRIFVPWLPCVLVVVTAAAVSLEGAICIVMALPVMLVFASIGGISSATPAGQSRAALPVVLLLPYLAMPFEAGRASPRRLVETTTEITVAAPPAVVWSLIVSVDSIRPAEQRRALFTTIGFPQPIAATLSHPGVGGVRHATFERGVVFLEAVTEWVPERRLRFTIDPVEVPPTALDPHVTIGGPYFDVLTGTYELHPLPDGGTRIVLRSEHRVSTSFNPYAAWWAERVMQSIQRHILEVLRDRAEGTAAMLAVNHAPPSLVAALLAAGIIAHARRQAYLRESSADRRR